MAPPFPETERAETEPAVVSIEPSVLSILILPALPPPPLLFSTYPSSLTRNSPESVIISALVVISPNAFISTLPPSPSNDEVSNEKVLISPEIALRLTSPPLPRSELELIRPEIISLLAFRSILPPLAVSLKLRIFPTLISP